MGDSGIYFLLLDLPCFYCFYLGLFYSLSWLCGGWDWSLSGVCQLYVKLNFAPVSCYDTADCKILVSFVCPSTTDM